MLFRELGFSLREIAKIIDSPGFEKKKGAGAAAQASKAQARANRQHYFGSKRDDNYGGENMDFSAFDSSMIDNETARAKAMWGHTDAYREFEEKARAERNAKAKPLRTV